MKLKLSDTDRSLLDRRIAETEKQTGIQIVLASVIRSDSYAEIPWKAFAVGASMASLVAIMLGLFFPGRVWDVSVLFSIAVIPGVGAICALLTVIFPGIARIFLSTQRKETETKQYADSLFLSRELFTTENRSGILLLISHFERQVLILPDTGVRDLLSTEVLDELISNMTVQLRRNELKQAMETGLVGIQAALGSPVSRRIDKNELSDEIIEEDGV